jgi:hypothetical protein
MAIYTMDQVIANSDQSNTHLSQINSNIEEFNAKTSDQRTDFMAGRIRTAGGKLSVASNNVGAFQLSNPVGSSRVITLWKTLVSCDYSIDVAFSFDATLAGTPVTHAVTNPNRATSVPITGTFRGSVGATTGGTTLSPIYRVLANRPETIDFITVILPGQSVEAKISAPTLNAAAFYASCIWSED